MKPLLSILIPTVPDRASVLSKLTKELDRQIARLDNEKEVELIINMSKRRRDGGPTIARKRNELLAESLGLFVVMIDDDDSISPFYLSRILDKIKEDKHVSCISHFIRVDWPNGKTELADVGLHYNKWSGGLSGKFNYTQPPYYKIPIRKYFYEKIRFNPNDKWAEDSDISKKLLQTMRGTRQARIEDALYTYNMPVNINPNKRY